MKIYETVYQPPPLKHHRCAEHFPKPHELLAGTILRCGTCRRYLYVENGMDGRYWARPDILDLHVWWRIWRWNRGI